MPSALTHQQQKLTRLICLEWHGHRGRTGAFPAPGIGGHINFVYRNMLIAERQRGQRTLEERLGRTLTKSPPRFVVELIGRPPSPRERARQQTYDPRPWSDGAKWMLDPIVLWQRAAGAITAIAEQYALISEDLRDFAPLRTAIQHAKENVPLRLDISDVAVEQIKDTVVLVEHARTELARGIDR